MATLLTTLYGNSAGPSPQAFRVVCQYGYTQASVTQGYYVQFRLYVEVTTGQSSNWTSSLKVSWSSNTYALSTAGIYADTGWVDKGWCQYGAAIGLGAQEAYYTGGSGTTYKSTHDCNYTLPKPTVTHMCKSFALGFQNDEGGYEYNSSAKLLSEFTFTKSYGDSITYVDSDHASIPNGYYLQSNFGLWDTNEGTISYHTIPYTTTSPAYALGAEFYMYPNTYNITYELVGGTNNSSNPSTYNVLYGVSLKEPTRTGYIFQGWYNGSTKVTGINEGCNATFSRVDAFYSALTERTTGDITLTAKWKAETYTISYNANGGTGAPSAQTKTYGVNLTLPSMKPTRTGYTFQGWAAMASATSAKWTAGGMYSEEGDATLYAVWQINTYQVSYNANGGTGAPSAQTKTYGVDLTLSSTKPTRTGYTFQGWGTSASNTSVDYAAGATYTANAAITLYAIWQINTYQVSYNANGGAGAPAAQTKTYGVDLTLSSMKPTKTGYTFQGWGISSTSTTVSYSAGGTYSKNAAITLYAIWSRNSYTVTFDDNGGSGGPGALTVRYDLSDYYDINTLTPSRTGYSFLGYYTAIEGGTQVYDADGYCTNEGTYWSENTWICAGNATFYAHWKAEYNCYLNVGGVNKKGIFWGNHNGTYGVGVPWKKIDGTWKKIVK